jgi:hypothetical protein
VLLVAAPLATVIGACVVAAAAAVAVVVSEPALDPPLDPPHAVTAAPRTATAIDADAHLRPRLII